MFDIGMYYEADSIEAALKYISENANAQIIAGGTDVLIKTRERLDGYMGRDLVGITRIKELKEIIETDEGIVIGSCCCFSEVERLDVITKNIKSLAVACGTVGGPQIRNMGTIGGNICNGATSADSASTLFALNAKLLIQSLDGKKEMPIQEFYVGPGKVKLAHGEILTGIKILKEDYVGYMGQYIKFSQRNAMDIATLGCSVMVKANNNTIEDLRIAYGVAGPTPLRASDAESFAKGLEATDENLNAIGEKAVLGCKARDSWRASKAFRENLIKELAIRAIKECIKAGANA